MADKLFTQGELNKIVAARLARERQRLTREFENSLKRCMAAVHLTLHQEMLGMKREMAAEMKDTYLSGVTEPILKEQPANPAPANPAAPKPGGGGEGQ